MCAMSGSVAETVLFVEFSVVFDKADKVDKLARLTVFENRERQCCLR